MTSSANARVRNFLNEFGSGFGGDVISDEAAMALFSGRPLVNRDGAGRPREDDGEESDTSKKGGDRRREDQRQDDQRRGEDPNPDYRPRRSKYTVRGRL